VSRFDECLDFVLDREGGFTNDPVDRGGATNFGITQRVYDQYLAAHGLPLASVRDITSSEVEAIYRANYWNLVRGDELSSPLDLVLFDCAVQHGAGRAIKFLQQAVMVDVDGVFGPATLRVTVDSPAVLVAARVMELRQAFYAKIIRNDPTQQRFQRGWNNRMVALAQQTGLTLA